MKKQINSEHLEGYLYDFDLEVKQVKNKESKNFGKDFIAGTVDIAVDENGLNVVQVHYTYVAPTTSKGAANKTFATLKKIIESGKTWLSVGKDEATMLKIDTALALNDFYTDDDTLVSAPRNEGGFIEIVSQICPDGPARHEFKTDMVITSIVSVDENVEKQIPAYTAVRGVIFNFKNEILPMEYRVLNPEGRKYFESLVVSNAEPLYTMVWGTIDNITTMVEQVEESAWGGSVVTMVPRKRKQWEITGAKSTPYVYDDKTTVTKEEMTAASQAREVYLAGVKKKRDEYLAQKANAIPSATSAIPTAPVASGDFKF